jgi:hypothetical protein
MELCLVERNSTAGINSGLQFSPEIVEMGYQIREEIFRAKWLELLQEIGRIDDRLVAGHDANSCVTERGNAHRASSSTGASLQPILILPHVSHLFWSVSVG